VLDNGPNQVHVAHRNPGEDMVPRAAANQQLHQLRA
jgi:hypothetical protein